MPADGVGLWLGAELGQPGAGGLFVFITTSLPWHLLKSPFLWVPVVLFSLGTLP